MPLLYLNIGSVYKVSLLHSQGIERRGVPFILLLSTLCFPTPGCWPLSTTKPSQVLAAGDLYALFHWPGQGPRTPTGWTTPTLTLCCPSECQPHPFSDLWTIHLKAPWVCSLCPPPQQPQRGKFIGSHLLVTESPLKAHNPTTSHLPCCCLVQALWVYRLDYSRGYSTTLPASTRIWSILNTATRVILLKGSLGPKLFDSTHSTGSYFTQSESQSGRLYQADIHSLSYLSPILASAYPTHHPGLLAKSNLGLEEERMEKETESGKKNGMEGKFRRQGKIEHVHLASMGTGK